MIKNWKQFESIEEDDLDVIRLEFDKCIGVIGFYFRDLLIIGKEKESITDFYIKTRDLSGEWGGGPVNKEFDDYFKHMYQRYSSNMKGNHPYKPSLGLFVNTEIASFFITYSIKDKKPFSITLRPYSVDFDKAMELDIIEMNALNLYSDHDLKMNPTLKNMNTFWKSIYYDKKATLDSTIDYLNINIVN